jgi:hypothetical protein
MNESDFAYIGVKDGTIRAIVADDPQYAKDTAKLVAEWIEMGRSIERVRWSDGVKRMKAEHERTVGSP